MKYKITIIYYAWLFKEFLKDMQGKFYFPFIMLYTVLIKTGKYLFSKATLF